MDEAPPGSFWNLRKRDVERNPKQALRALLLRVRQAPPTRLYVRQTCPCQIAATSYFAFLANANARNPSLTPRERNVLTGSKHPRFKRRSTLPPDVRCGSSAFPIPEPGRPSFHQGRHAHASRI